MDVAPTNGPCCANDCGNSVTHRRLERKARQETLLFNAAPEEFAAVAESLQALMLKLKPVMLANPNELGIAYRLYDMLRDATVATFTNNGVEV